MTSALFAFLRFKLAFAVAIALACAVPADRRGAEKSQSPLALDAAPAQSATSDFQSDTSRLVLASLYASNESEQQTQCRASDSKRSVSSYAELQSGSAVLLVFAPTVEGEGSYLVCVNAQNIESTPPSRRRWCERSARGPPRV